MLYTKGTKVTLKATGDTGIITELDDDDLMWVQLEDGEEIPVYADAILPFQPVKEPASTDENAEKPTEYPLHQRLRQGILLIFDPVYRTEDAPAYYQLFLVNDSPRPVQYTLSLFLRDELVYEQSQEIPRWKSHALDRLEYDELSDHPKVSVRLRKTALEGMDGEWSKVLRIKPKTFFKNLQDIAQLDREGILFYLTDEIKASSSSEEDLKSYTKKNYVPKPKPRQSRAGYVSLHSLEELAHFEITLDLHIEQLTHRHQKMHAGEKLRLQLQTFDAYLSKALRLGVDRVFIIHGVGKGRLRDEIAQRLRAHPSVKTFKNEHHPRYGFGATEVIF